MHRITMFVGVLSFLLVSGCVHHGPTDSIPLDPVRTHFLAGTPVEFSTVLPEGWSQRTVTEEGDGATLAFIAFSNPALNARAFLEVKRTTRTPYEEANDERESMLSYKRRCTPVALRLQPPGIVASFTVGGRHSTGAVAVMRLHNDPQLLTRVLGAWPSAVDAEASADFNFIVTNLKSQRVD
jgi:hypothetical protein